MATFVSPESAPSYPVRLSMRYPERVSRLSTAFRLILVIPVLIFVALLSGGSYAQSWSSNGTARGLSAGAGGGILLAIWATILLRGTIPGWLFDFRVAVNRFTYRAYSYAALLTDRYPAFEGDWDLNYEVDYPGRLSRWRVFFWKILTALPHFVVLLALLFASFLIVIVGWISILFTGTFPRGLHQFVVGVMRWGARVSAYVESLTDAFPPFSLDEDAGPAAPSTVTLSAVIGGMLLAAAIAGGIVAGIFIYRYTHEIKTVHASYSGALGGSLPSDSSTVKLDKVVFELRSGADPASIDALRPHDGGHLIEFTLDYFNQRVLRAGSHDIDGGTILLETQDEGTRKPVLLTADGHVVPANVSHSSHISLRAVFEVKDSDTVVGLRAYPAVNSDRHIRWRFN